MTLLKIAQIGHPILREQSREVSLSELQTSEMQKFIDDLIETMRDANGAGIAAPQVYNSVQICVIEVNNNPRYPYKPNIPLTVLVNPKIEFLTEETYDNFEGCLSVPNLRGVVPRISEIKVSFLDRFGKKEERIVKGISAGTFQHEIDHLHGKLFVDGVEDTTTLCTLAEFDRYFKDEFVKKMVPFIEKMGG